MPSRVEEFAEALGLLIDALVSDLVAPDEVPWEKFGSQLQREILAAVAREKKQRRRARQDAQRRAMALLKTFLSPEQREVLRRCKYFFVTGSLGGTYRIYPRRGKCEKVVRHGTRWFAEAHYCLHDAGNTLPKADVALGHVLWLSADERLFLSTANKTGDLLYYWSGDYRRRLRAARLARQERHRESGTAGEGCGVPQGAP